MAQRKNSGFDVEDSSFVRPSFHFIEPQFIEGVQARNFEVPAVERRGSKQLDSYSLDQKDTGAEKGVDGNLIGSPRHESVEELVRHYDLNQETFQDLRKTSKFRF